MKKMKVLLLTSFMTFLVVTSVLSNTSVMAQQVDLSTTQDTPRPDQLWFDRVKDPKAFLKILLQLESANFSDDSVYYSSNLIYDEYGFSLPVRRTAEHTIRIDPIKTRIRLNKTIEKLELLNATIISPALDRATTNWDNTTFWNEVSIEKSFFEDAALDPLNLDDLAKFKQYYVLMAMVASAPENVTDFDFWTDLELVSQNSIVDTINYVHSLANMDKVRYIHGELRKLLSFDPLIILWAGIRDFDIAHADFAYYIRHWNFRYHLFLRRLQFAYNAMQTRNSPIEITQRVVADLAKQVTVEGIRVTVLHDKDRSVIKAMGALRDNRSVSKQPFTGDESFTFVTQYHVKEKLWGTFNFYNNFIGNREFAIFGNIPGSPRLNGIIDGFWTRTIGAPYLKMKAFLNPPEQHVISRLKPVRSAWSGYEVSQLKIDDLDFVRLANRIAIKNLNFTYISHKSHGLYVYNDTNDNNILDIGMRKDNLSSITENQYPNTNEAIGKAIFLNYEDREILKPTTTNDVLSFGKSLSNVNTTVVPFGQPSDLALVNNTARTKHVVDEIGINFHYSVNDTASKLKYDYLLGDWSRDDSLEGLSLSFLMTTTVIDRQSTREINNISTEENSQLNASADAKRIRTLKFKAGSTLPDFEVSLDEIPYLWNNTTSETAYGMTIPLGFLNFYRGVSTESSESVSYIQALTQVKKYAYAISYPTWSGQSISHDPVFSTIVGESEEEEWTNMGEDTSQQGIPGFELLGIGALAALPIIRRKKAKN